MNMSQKRRYISDLYIYIHTCDPDQSTKGIFKDISLRPHIISQLKWKDTSLRSHIISQLKWYFRNNNLTKKIEIYKICRKHLDERQKR